MLWIINYKLFIGKLRNLRLLGVKVSQRTVTKKHLLAEICLKILQILRFLKKNFNCQVRLRSLMQIRIQISKKHSLKVLEKTWHRSRDI